MMIEPAPRDLDTLGQAVNLDAFDAIFDQRNPRAIEPTFARHLDIAVARRFWNHKFALLTASRNPLSFHGQAVCSKLYKDRKSTRLNSVTNAHLVCRLLLEKNNTQSY